MENNLGCQAVSDPKQNNKISGYKRQSVNSRQGLLLVLRTPPPRSELRPTIWKCGP